ncbi:MAG: bis(5'-nucleosyl)-tetraphosphatase (symmetrical) YqeK [Candidatus Velthaea sp.]
MSPPEGRGAALMHAMRRVRKELGQDYRYAHTLRVARLAARLAWVHGEDPDKARLAGLLHDLARLFSADRLIEACTERGLPIEAFERANPIVLHARLGAELAREAYGVDDEAVLSAIRKHTVAAAVMSRLDTIVYLADGLEPGRTFAARAGFEQLAFRDLGAAMRAVLGSTIAYLRGRGLEVAPPTRAAAETFGLDPASVSENRLETPGVTPPPSQDAVA